MNRLTCMIRSIKFPLIIFIGAIGLLPGSTFAQTVSVGAQSSSQPTFDVVSIRPMRENDSTPAHITNSDHNGYIKAVNVNLKALMEVAYDLPDLRMYGGPDWLTTQKFSLEAKADPKLEEQIAGLSSEQVKQLKRNMLAALLSDRFKLMVHTETREMPVYAMVVAKGGPRLDGTKLSPDTLPAGEDRITVSSGSDSLGVLAYELSWRLGRPVIDRTDLRYQQELKLSWQDNEAASVDANGPSLFTAIQEQLGLKLESTRCPVSVLLIDHADRPTEN